MNFETLYSINNKGKYLIWKIKVIKNTDHESVIVYTYGQIDGKQQTNTKVINCTKSKKTVLEQAIFIAKGLWNDKKNKKLYTEDLDAIKNQHENVNIFQYKDIDTNFRPHLAKTYTNKLKIDFPIIAQAKYDGSRGNIFTDSDGSIIANTRQGIPK